jgi:hypothetical protein
MNPNKLRRNRTKRDFLQTFFPKKDSYQEIEVNGFYLIQQWNGNTKEYDVAIYTKDSFKKRKDFIEKNFGIELDFE